MNEQKHEPIYNSSKTLQIENFSPIKQSNNNERIFKGEVKIEVRKSLDSYYPSNYIEAMNIDKSTLDVGIKKTVELPFINPNIRSSSTSNN